MRHVMAVAAILGGLVLAPAVQAAPRCGFPGEGHRVCEDAARAIRAQAEYFVKGRDAQAAVRRRAHGRLMVRFKGEARAYIRGLTAAWPLDQYQPNAGTGGCIQTVTPQGHAYVVTAWEVWDIVPRPDNASSIFGVHGHLWRMVMRQSSHGTWLVHGIKVLSRPRCH